MEWKDSSVTLPIPKQNELTNLIAQNGRKLELPAKKIFLEPGDKLRGIYYIAEGRTRHYMIARTGPKSCFIHCRRAGSTAKRPVFWTMPPACTPRRSGPACST